MKLLFLFAIISLWSLQQKPDTWKVIETHPHPSRVHNSIEVKKADSVLYVQFDFPPTASIFPAKGDKITFTYGRKGMIDGKQSFDVINIFKKTL